jgi:DNA repair exonuclease SbcCD ATPase subunit
MIVFNTIRWKNFLATGNHFTEIPLNTHPDTLIIGENGAGKSTVLDALTFALFNKPYRNINKPQIVNSINSKNCLVELEFAIGSKQYMVRRGIKPNVFEIHMNGNLVNQDSKARDYQDMLERQILKMNYKSFTQIVILGSSSFTPFMQLPAGDRRAVIEDLLDIQIFSSMNGIVKERLGSIKTQLNEIKIRVEATKEKITLHKKHIEELNRNTKELIEGKEEQIENARHEIVELQQELNKHNAAIDALTDQIGDHQKMLDKQRKLLQYETRIKSNKKKVQKEIDFYEDHDSCPTCEQDIPETHKQNRLESCHGEVQQFDDGLKKLSTEQSAVVNRLATITGILTQVQELNKEVANTNTSIAHSRKYIATLEGEVKKLKDTKTASGDTAKQSQELLDELTGYIEQRKSITDDRQYLDMASQLLKDGGIKTRIIRQYLPIINKLVNKYLAAMDFFVNFHMDEEFKEVIKSRHRDDFSYANFSEGEKQKIDLALMLTWRAVARLKNSVNTNLLILDETFDSSLDAKGTDALLEILHQLPENTNIFVISHKDQLHDKFNQSIKFEKKQNFSRIAAA